MCSLGSGAFIHKAELYGYHSKYTSAFTKTIDEKVECVVAYLFPTPCTVSIAVDRCTIHNHYIRAKMQDYKCTLNEQSAEKASAELNEDPKERTGAVQTLRGWIEQQSWLKTPTDTNFLLQFLRARKFSQLGARDLLTNYWTVRTKHFELYKDLDPSSSKIHEILDLGIIVMMPGYDSQGRKVIIDRMGYLDVSLMKSKFTVNDIFRAATCIMDCCMLDENVQVNGFCILLDQTHFSHRHAETVYGIDNTKRAVKMWMNSYTARHKQINVYNMGPVSEAFLNVVRMLMTEKIRNRFYFHGHSLVTVYDTMDMGCLPDEYLPDDYTGPRVGNVKHVISTMKEALNKPEFVQRMLDIGSGKYGVDQSLKPKCDEPAESFRKLNI
ncbi:hypothetical protein ScPMuIL_000616 [Solemya velum]